MAELEEDKVANRGRLTWVLVREDRESDGEGSEEDGGDVMHKGIRGVEDDALGEGEDVVQLDERKGEPNTEVDDEECQVKQQYGCHCVRKV